MVWGAATKVGRVLGFGVLFAAGLFLTGFRSTPATVTAEGPDATTEVDMTPIPAPADAAPADPGPILASIAAAAPPPAPATSDCPAGMVEVQGDFCPYVEQKCLRWVDPETHMRCAEFAPTSECPTRVRHKHFCIDRYEYPNQAGEKPQVMVTWNEAQKLCAGEHKRLCGESEWTLACEGAERLPYPYGYARNADACNIDKPHPEVFENRFRNPRTAAAELARLDQRDPSGANESCVSPYGVYDMTGNVDEWVVSESKNAKHKSSLKGGYWGPVRDRCRPVTTAHDEKFAFYQIGFRCCADPAPTHGVTHGAGSSHHEIIAGS
jgi:sulfatase modifying factor 1